MEPDEVGLRPVPLSALQHYVYCPRQCALIHVEQVWAENLSTARGRRDHDRVHEEHGEQLAEVRVERALPLLSERLGLTGIADVVEFAGDQPRPVEYKHGRRRDGLHDEVQLCAQALCLEEMLGVTIPAGDIFHHGSRRRREVVLTASLRALTEQTVGEVRAMLEAGLVPAPEFGPKCRDCSLNEVCLPDRHGLALADLFEPPAERG